MINKLFGQCKALAHLGSSKCIFLDCRKNRRKLSELCMITEKVVVWNKLGVIIYSTLTGSNRLFSLNADSSFLCQHILVFCVEREV